MGSAAKISGSLSRGLSNMSTNSDFSSVFFLLSRSFWVDIDFYFPLFLFLLVGQSQEKLTRRKATSLSSGLGQGLFSFGSGLMSGVYGVGSPFIFFFFLFSFSLFPNFVL